MTDQVKGKTSFGGEVVFQRAVRGDGADIWVIQVGEDTTAQYPFPIDAREFARIASEIVRDELEALR